MDIDGGRTAIEKRRGEEEGRRGGGEEGRRGGGEEGRSVLPLLISYQARMDQSNACSPMYARM